MNWASQVLSEPDGRIAISFMNATTVEAPLVLRARPDAVDVLIKAKRRVERPPS